MMDVQGKRFATGVSDAGGSVPRFGETIVGAMTSEYRGKLAYEWAIRNGDHLRM